MGEALYYKDMEGLIDHTITPSRLGSIMVLLGMQGFSFRSFSCPLGISRVGMEARGRVETVAARQQELLQRAMQVLA